MPFFLVVIVIGFVIVIVGFVIAIVVVGFFAVVNEIVSPILLLLSTVVAAGGSAFGAAVVGADDADARPVGAWSSILWGLAIRRVSGATDGTGAIGAECSSAGFLEAREGVV